MINLTSIVTVCANKSETYGTMLLTLHKLIKINSDTTCSGIVKKTTFHIAIGT